MRHSFHRKALYTFLFFMITLGSGICNADDTEIYFNSAANNPAVRPNVLLILDTSGSMDTKLTDGSGDTRMQAMQKALGNILDSLTGVNIGLMRFNGDNGASVMYPITYIDALNKDTVSEENDAIATLNYSVADDNSDAQELVSTGAVTLNTAGPMTVPQIAATYLAATPVSIAVSTSADDGYELNGSSTISSPGYTFQRGDHTQWRSHRFRHAGRLCREYYQC